MKAIYSVLSLVLAFGISAQAQTEETKWIIPDVTYTCIATIAKDWSKGKKESFFMARTEAFDVVARTSGNTSVVPSQFTVVSENSELKNLKDTDLGEFEIGLKITLKGDYSVGLEGSFSLKPKNMKKAVHLIEESEPTTEKIPEKLYVSVRAMFGTDKDIGKSGPINSFVSCELKK